ncbi:hypothetical protein [Candidatus Kuenenia stuttgartiensis]|nr:hypothetical protein [Candidatus Kuenenia stuttgartiensis]
MDLPCRLTIISAAQDRSQITDWNKEEVQGLIVFALKPSTRRIA